MADDIWPFSYYRHGQSQFPTYYYYYYYYSHMFFKKKKVVGGSLLNNSQCLVSEEHIVKYFFLRSILQYLDKFLKASHTLCSSKLRIAAVIKYSNHHKWFGRDCVNGGSQKEAADSSGGRGTDGNRGACDWDRRSKHYSLVIRADLYIKVTALHLRNQSYRASCANIHNLFYRSMPVNLHSALFQNIYIFLYIVIVT